MCSRSHAAARAKGLGCALAAGLLGQRAADIDEAIADLLALLGPESSTAREPPGWVRMVAEAVRDCDYLTAEDAARLAGVHRVHLSRAFAKHFGVPFSAYRKRVMIGRAIERAVRSAEPLAKIAHASGFADQSHMHRDLASLVGLTPRQFRAAFRAAASPR